MSKVKRCAGCGTAVVDEAAFCPFCGFAFQDSPKLPRQISCLNCINYELCFLRHALERFIYTGRGLLTETKEEEKRTPDDLTILYVATANACKKYEREK